MKFKGGRGAPRDTFQDETLEFPRAFSMVVVALYPSTPLIIGDVVEASIGGPTDRLNMMVRHEKVLLPPHEYYIMGVKGVGL